MCIRDRGSVEVDPDSSEPKMQWTASEGATVTETTSGIYTVTMLPNSSVLFWPKDTPQPEAIVKQVPMTGKPHRFGLQGR